MFTFQGVTSGRCCFTADNLPLTTHLITCSWLVFFWVSYPGGSGGPSGALPNF